MHAHDLFKNFLTFFFSDLIDFSFERVVSYLIHYLRGEITSKTVNQRFTNA